MVEDSGVMIENREQLEDWLEGKPRSWAAAIAVRAALRAVPFSGMDWETGEADEKRRLDLMLIVFRAVSLSWGATTYPSKEVAVAAASASASANATFAATAGAANFYAGAYVAAYAATYAATYAGADVIPDVTAAAAASAFANTIVDVAVSASALWESVAADAKFLDRTEDPRRLAISPLWPNGEPNWFTREYSSFPHTLINVDPNWNVWLHWYDARVNGGFMPGLGRAGEEQVMARLIQQDDDWWTREPRDVNRDITAWVDAARLEFSPDIENIPAPEPQNPAGLRFTTRADEPIDVDWNAGKDRLADDAAARDRHGETRRLAEQLIASFDPQERGANTATTLIEATRLYLEALGASPQEAKADLVVIRGDLLRQTLAAQENRDDDFSDIPELSEKYTLALGHLLTAHNPYVGLDPVLAGKDEGLAGPDAVKTLVSPNEGRQIVQIAVTTGAVTQQVGDVINEQAQITPDDPAPENRKSRRFSESVKNLFRAGFSYIWQHKGKFSGGTAFVFVARWVLQNEATVLGYFAESPAMLETIRGIIAFLKTLPLL